MISHETTSTASNGSQQPGGPQQFSAPTVALPKGGGAIRGIGEKFAANPVTGTGSMSVPIAVSPGRSGFAPQLSLSYDSGAGNGPFGFGWSLSLPSITRKTDKGLPLYDDSGESDVYILSGAEDLVPFLNPDGTRYEDDTSAPGYLIHRYRPRIEGLFARIERWTAIATEEIHWRSITRDNVTTFYGKDDNSRIADPDDVNRIFSWLICQSYDDKGNAVAYKYAEENDEQVDLSLTNERNRIRTANRYPKRITYGNRVSRLLEPDLDKAEWLFEVVFDYDEAHYEEIDPNAPSNQHRRVRATASVGQTWRVRPDPFSSYRSGFEVRTCRRCRRVLMFHHIPDLPTGERGYEGLVRSTEFDYDDIDIGRLPTIDEELAHTGSTRFASFIRRITQSGYVRQGNGTEHRNGVHYATYLKKSLPPLEFAYSKASIQDEVVDLDPESLENLPVGLDGSTYQWVDLHGEGISGILTEQAGAWFYKQNLSPLPVDGSSTATARLAPLERIHLKPNETLVGGHAQFMDLAGDGQPDLVVMDGSTPGLYEHDDRDGWQPFRPFLSRLNRTTRDPNLRFIDIDGDGHADALITEGEAFVWHRSLAEEGFGPARRVAQPFDEEQGPRLIFADAEHSIHLADMCGDGLTDIVRIRNGEVCFWPNLGYGRFGAKVSLDNAPWFDNTDQFNQSRIRLADIDGSGTTDIIYLHRDGPHIYFNQSGNRLGEARSVQPFPEVDDLTSITTADLLGNGTACLVWSSPLPGAARCPMKYVDLMGGVKPHLLIRTVNNLGAETEVQYGPSTKFYLADKQAGRPWVTRLPFPVHVVERVVVHDRVSGNRFSTRYAYHHGYFDSDERELRGFGMVEQWDTEEFASLAPDGVIPAGSNVDESSHLPRVLTRTWFHTGMYTGRHHVSDFFAGLLDADDTGEYYREPDLNDSQARAFLLEDTVLPDRLTIDEEREACRALKGSMLRQEVYALDGTAKEPHPYSVVEQNFTIRLIQPRGGNRHAVFLTHARETLSHHYERNPADPRTQHALTLDVDDYGNVWKSVVIGYGRRAGQSALAGEDRRTQERALIIYTENEFTNAIDDVAAYPNDYRTPLPCESWTYELTGIRPEGNADRFSFEEWTRNDFALAVATPEIPYERTANDTVPQKRPIEHSRTYYRRDDFDKVNPLPLKVLQPLALPFESYTLAFTPGLITTVYGDDRVTSAMLETDGGYVHTEGDADWWIPSGRVFFSPGRDDTAAEEGAYARANFFLPHRFRDPFHTDAVPTESVITYDAYALLVEQTRDAADNYVTVGERNPDPTQPIVRRMHDYRVLQPALVMDPNRNRSAIAVDALGMVVGTAVMGKPGQVVGDSLDGFRSDLTAAEIDEFLDDPKGPPATALLGNATTRVVYDLTAYQREPDPSAKLPAVAATIIREIHAADLDNGETTIVQVSLSYSDGFGREIQKKIQAEPGPGPQRDAGGRIIMGPDGRPRPTPDNVDPRWVGSGWTVFNNKGKPVRQYEPFFTEAHRFERDVRIGVSPVLFYDPVGRVVATLHPNHTWEKVRFDPWRQETWDVNDTMMVDDPATDQDVGSFFARLATTEYLPTWHALRTNATQAPLLAQRYPDPADRTGETQAAEKTRIHAATPTVAHADVLGRTFLTIAHNRFRDAAAGAAGATDPPVEEFHETRVILDVEGNQREVVDARGRVVMRYAYTMAGPGEGAANRIRQSSMEAGERWILNDVSGKPLYTWDSRDHRFRTTYDALRRPTESFLQVGVNPEVIVGRIRYGESRPSPAAENGNVRGKIIELRDQAGLVTSDEYDFKGNLQASGRRLAQSYDTTLNWGSPVPLEPETYRSRTRYDALNRPIQLVAPHSDEEGTAINVIQPVYNEANLLEKIYLWLDRDKEPDEPLDPATAEMSPVTGIDYDAKGQRLRIEYGNGVRTSYAYDPFTFRLTHLLTTRSATTFPDDCPRVSSAAWPGCQVQNLHYSYDPAGNITRIRDDAQQTIFFRNLRVEPSSDYTYDAVYRLISATGREHVGQTGMSTPHSHDDAPRVNLPHPGDGNAMATYCESYVYDAVGNIMEMIHRDACPGAASWRRSYAYDEQSQLESHRRSNRLTSTTVGATTQTYSAAGDGYDAHGSMLRMPHLQELRWDFRDQLRMTRRQRVNDEDVEGSRRHGERTWYVYDSSGQRVRKVTESAGSGIKEERIYLGGFEVYRRHGAEPLVRETLHVMDNTQRVALVETRIEGNEPDVPRRLVRYQFGNHLGSVGLELDEEGRLISYEEYTPYGSTAYQAVRNQTETPKRYRYSGKERDEESGLYYYGVRYYVAFLGHWTSSDPIGLKDGVNTYQMTSSNPIRFVDRLGLSGEETKVVKPTVLEALKQKGLVYATEVSFDVLGKSGEVVTSGRFDVAFIDPQSKQFVFPELKGKDLEALTKNQKVYKPLFELPEGAQIRVTGHKGGTVGMIKGAVMTVSGESYVVVGMDNLADFRSALDEVAGGGKIKTTFLDKSGTVHMFRTTEEFEQFLKDTGRTKPTPPSGPKGFVTLPVLGVMLGTGVAGMQLVQGGNEIAQGKTAEGVVTTAEGSTTLFTTFAPFAQGVVAEAGLAAGVVTAAAAIAVGGAVSLAGTEAKRSLRGEKTTAAEAVDYYVDLVEKGEDQGGVKGMLMKTGGYVGGSFASLIAAGQGYEGR